MKYCTFDDCGCILKTGTAPDSLQDFLRQAEGPNILFFPNDETLDDAAHYVSDGQLLAKPARPGPSYVWDASTHSWQPDLADAKARRIAAVEVERDSRITAAVIVYDGKNLDADSISMDRLGKKLAALASYEARGEQMPTQMLVWRDADNITHSFSSHAEYKLWLCGFAVALDTRGTEAFAWSWEKKGQVAQATTLSEVEGIALDD